jgi:hypothetical protein
MSHAQEKQTGVNNRSIHGDSKFSGANSIPMNRDK